MRYFIRSSRAIPPLLYDATVRFISSGFTEEEYGPKKAKLFALVNDLKSKALPAVKLNVECRDTRLVTAAFTSGRPGH
jgi:hypothetical protein